MDFFLSFDSAFYLVEIDGGPWSAKLDIWVSGTGGVIRTSYWPAA